MSSECATNLYPLLAVADIATLAHSLLRPVEHICILKMAFHISHGCNVCPVTTRTKQHVLVQWHFLGLYLNDDNFQGIRSLQIMVLHSPLVYVHHFPTPYKIVIYNTKKIHLHMVYK